MYLYYFLAAISVYFGIQSLRSGFRYVAYVKRETKRPLSDFHPFASVIAPSRGLEPGLAENLATLLDQDYPAYEVLFVFDRADDPAIEMLDTLAGKHVARKIVVAGPATNSGQKVHNLRAAVRDVDPQSEVLAFVDTDARPGKLWLKQLIAPLADETLGASTGYRWFVPLNGGLASRLRSVWNASIASALGAARRKNFCWGGSTAIRRNVFERLNVCERWQGTVSDDFTITRVLKEAELPIHFTPNCLVPSLGDCNAHDLVEFTTRQVKITRVYAEHLWLPLLLGSSLFGIAFFGGIILLVARIIFGQSILFLGVVLGLIFTLGALKSFIRWRAVRIPLVNYRDKLNRDLLAHIFLWPIASMLYLYNAIAAGFSRRINWRGIIYELKSPNEAVIISRDA